MSKRQKLTLETLTLDYLKARVDFVGECWIWRGAKDNDGYGHMGIERKTYKVSRLAYALVHGPIPAGVHVCHNCPGGDNPACINPGHLFPCTRNRNMQDMVAKGRHVYHRHPERRPVGTRSGAYTHPEKVLRGETNGMHRLTEEKVKEILRLAAQPKANVSAIARQFGVDPTTAAHVVKGRTWKHVPRE